MADQHPHHTALKQASQQLPEGYQKIGTIDLSRNPAAIVALNVVGLGLLIFFGSLFFKLAYSMRSFTPFGGAIKFSLDELAGVLLFIALFIVMSGLVIVTHEAVHGAFFWLFTRKRPVFGFRGAYAFAAAPSWYIPRNQYMVIGIAPLIVLSLLGILGIWIVPEGLLLPLVLLMTLNAAGAVADILTVAWLFLKPASTLAQDSGDKVVLYGPGPLIQEKEL